MQFQFLPPKRINRLLRLQSSVVQFYQKMAAITTEQDLKKIYLALRTHHLKASNDLKEILFPNAKTNSILVRNGKSYLEKMWRKILFALLISNRTKMTEYCRQNEIKLLQELQGVITSAEVSSEIQKVLVQYEQGIYNYLEKLKNIPAHSLRKSKTA